MAKKAVKATAAASPKRSAREIANDIAIATDSDVLLYNGPIERGLDSLVISMCSGWRPRKNVLLLLVTEGGDADAAFRIARCLQQRYEKYTCLVTGWCKSAGTLIALGATELAVADHGEMGPLDVQLSRKDELFETQSGLTVTSALTTLHKQAFAAFEEFMLQVKVKSGASITTHTAMEIASSLAVGLFSGIYSQVDPMHVGEAGRANRVAKQYGEVLIAKGRNSTSEKLDRLIGDYSSHGFVIDRLEAKNLFNRVRQPTLLELELALALDRRALWPIPYPNEPAITFVSEQRRAPKTPIKRTKATTGGAHVEVPGRAAELAPNAAGSNAPAADGTTGRIQSTVTRIKPARRG